MNCKQILWVLVFLCTSTFAQNNSETDSVQQVEEIVVEGNTKTFRYKNGNLKIDVANSILNAIPTTIDLLAKLPKVQMSPDKSAISVIGKGNPVLYLDDQKIEMNDLVTLSVEDIKSVEILNNPSSKYEAEGRVVILITRKRNRKEGFQTVISETVSFKKRLNNYNGITSSFKRKNTEFKVNFQFNALNVWESNGNNYKILNNNVASNYRVVGETQRNNYVFGTGIFHKLNDDDSFSFSINGNLKNDDFQLRTKTLNEANNQTAILNTLAKATGNRNFINSFLNYTNKMNDSAIFFTGLQYSNYATDASINTFNTYNATNFELFQELDQDFKIHVFSGRVDLEKKFANEIKWETGAAYSMATANSFLQLENFEEATNSQKYYNLKERNTSGYTQLSGTLKKVSWMFGIRVEHTFVEGKFAHENALTVHKNYANFFPKAQIEIEMDSLKTLTFNYTKNIVRPNYSETSHGQTYINPYFVFSSTITLNPSVSDEISANFQYKDKSIKVAYYQNKNAIYYGFKYAETENILYYRPENFEIEKGYNLEITLPFQHQFWTSSNTLSFVLNTIEDKFAIASKSKPYVYFYSNQMFKLKNNWTVSVIGWGLSKRNEGVFQRNALFNLDSAISKSFSNFTATLSYNNILKKNKYTDSFEIAGVNSKTVFFADTYEFSVALKYTFGKLKASIYKEKEINENSARIK